jgi:hypothetical protein
MFKFAGLDSNGFVLGLGSTSNGFRHTAKRINDVNDNINETNTITIKTP